MFTITITNPTTQEIISRDFPTAEIANDFFVLCALALGGKFGDEPMPYFDDDDEFDEKE